MTASISKPRTEESSSTLGNTHPPVEVNFDARAYGVVNKLTRTTGESVGRPSPVAARTTPQPQVLN